MIMSVRPEGDHARPGDNGRARWQRRYDGSRLRDADFTTLSGLAVDPAYGPPDGAVVPGFDRIGWPGEFPFTRGLYPTGYRGRTWTIRQFSGFGNPKQTNERYKMLLQAGGGGLSVAFDMPTLMGRDSDDPRALGQVGHCGVAIDSTADMDVLFAGIPLADVSTSMTISGPEAPVFCMYLAAAERQGADLGGLNGTLQTDIFKEYIAQKEWLFPPEPHLRLIGDLMEYCAREIPAYKPLSVSGYHIREAGSTAAQELAFTLADGFGYVELGLSRGLDVETFTPGLSFFFDAHIDFFEEIAKFRAARRIWARWLRDTYGARTERAQWLRFHTQTAGVSLTAQQPDNNVVRTAIEALAAVLGGTNSLHTNRLEAEAEEVFAKIRAMSPDGTMTGGILRGIEDGWFMAEIADASFAYQRQLEKGEKKVVGVNCHTDTVEKPVEILRVSHEVERAQVRDLAGRRAARDQRAVDAALAAMLAAARSSTASWARCLRRRCASGSARSCKWPIRSGCRPGSAPRRRPLVRPVLVRPVLVRPAGAWRAVLRAAAPRRG